MRLFNFDGVNRRRCACNDKIPSGSSLGLEYREEIKVKKEVFDGFCGGKGGYRELMMVGEFFCELFGCGDEKCDPRGTPQKALVHPKDLVLAQFRFDENGIKCGVYVVEDLAKHEGKDSDTQNFIGSMFEIIYSIDDEVREIECCGGSNAKKHIGFTSRQEIFLDINGAYDVLMNEKMFHFEIRTYLFNEEIV
ncbi:hypothetical protein Tco_1499223 [Tanacetum coccineum]